MMPAYNFQKRFVPMLIDGSKKHTIRRRRKRPTRLGDVLHLYTGMRTKKCELIAKVKCYQILPVQVMRGAGFILDSQNLSDEDTHAFARADGFVNAWEMFDFFDQYPLEVLRDELEVIYWR